MYDIEMAELRVITSFPPPFQLNYMPYGNHFSEKSLQNCSTSVCEQKVFKIIVLGDVSVGKTCIIQRFCYQVFNSNYKATIGVDFEIEMFNILGYPCTLQIWDTAGQERFKSIAQSYYRGAHAIIIVFDMSDIHSLSNCSIWYNEALNAGNTDETLTFLVGNKTDLLSKSACTNVEDLVLNSAKILKAEYWSVSAKAGQNIKQLFNRIAVLIFDRSIQNETEEVVKTLHLGKSLVSFEENFGRKKNEKSNCRCNI